MTARALLEAQLRATHATLEAALQQVEVAIIAVCQEPEEAAEAGGCPRCGASDFADGGTDAESNPITVCAGCNANIAAGRVIGG